MSDQHDLAGNTEAALLSEGHLHCRQPAGVGEERSVQASIDRSNALTCGHRACQGCGEALGARYAIDAAMRTTAGQLIAVNATGCLEVFTTPYPETSWQAAWLHSLFGNAAAVATGVAAAMRVKRRSNVRVIAQGGDGGTTDIGFGCLSGMFERNDDVLYICYDNEAYMNTGVQRRRRRRPVPAPPPRRQSVPSRATCSAPARACRRSPSPMASPTPRPRRLPTSTTWSERSLRRWASTAHVIFTSTCRARSAGARRRTTPFGSPGWRWNPGYSQYSRPSTAW